MLLYVVFVVIVAFEADFLVLCLRYGIYDIVSVTAYSTAAFVFAIAVFFYSAHCCCIAPVNNNRSAQSINGNKDPLTIVLFFCRLY